MHFKQNGNNETSRKGPNVYKRKFSMVRKRESRYKVEKLGFRKRESFEKELQLSVLRMRKEFSCTAISGLTGY